MAGGVREGEWAVEWACYRWHRAKLVEGLVVLCEHLAFPWYEM